MSKSFNSAIVNKIISDFQNGDKFSAFKKLNKYIIDNPKDETAIYNFAYMAEFLGNIDVAIKNYKQT